MANSTTKRHQISKNLPKYVWKCILCTFLHIVQEIWWLTREPRRFSLYLGDSCIIWKSWHRCFVAMKNTTDLFQGENCSCSLLIQIKWELRNVTFWREVKPLEVRQNLSKYCLGPEDKLCTLVQLCTPFNSWKWCRMYP